MKRPILIFAILFAFACGSEAQEKSKTDSLIFTELNSKVLNEKRRIVVHLPLNYTKQSSKKYPVMYVLDAGSMDFNIADRLFTLASARIAPECITVGILNARNTRERDQTPTFMQTNVDDPASPFGKSDQFLEYIQSELIPLIDSSYRTTGYQTISGHSRAGLFVLYTLLLKPELFNARFCYSTPAWRFDNILIKKLEEALRKKPLNKDSYLFFTVGENENPNIKASFNILIEMLKSTKPKRLKWGSYLTPLADHQTNPVFSAAKALAEWAKVLKVTSE